MIDLASIIRDGGRFWWSYVDFMAGDADIAIPTPLRRGPTDASGQRFAEERGLIILGWSYNFVADAAGEGFDLESVDSVFIPGTTSTFKIYGDLSQAAGRVAHNVTDVAIPLSKADCIPTPTSGATLRFNLIGTPTSGTLLIWGVETSEHISKFVSGSPVTFPST